METRIAEALWRKQKNQFSIFVTPITFFSADSSTSVTVQQLLNHPTGLWRGQLDFL
jgi:hypothetical protein